METIKDTEKLVDPKDVMEALKFYNNMTGETFVDKMGRTSRYIFFSKWPEINDKGQLIWKSKTYYKGANDVKNQCWNLAQQMNEQGMGRTKTLYNKIRKRVRQDTKIKVEELNEQI